MKTLSIKESEVLVFAPLVGPLWGVLWHSFREVLLKPVP